MTPQAGYAAGRALSRRHARTYHLASLLLPTGARDGVYALYGFARLVDDLVDHPGPGGEDAALAQVDAVERTFLAAVAGDAIAGAEDTGTVTAPQTAAIISAVADTAVRHRLPLEPFDDFFTAMRMDAPGSPTFTDRYRDFEHLADYTRGSAAAIGRLLLPILGVPAGTEAYRAAEPAAAGLGEAFQLTNFLRDVAEDLDRGRVYLPADVLTAFGVADGELSACRRAGVTSPALRRALAYLVAVNRAGYRRAVPGIARLPRAARPAIAAAAAGYEEILTVIEDGGYQVMAGRAVVPAGRRLRRALAAAVTARH